ncbi:MAG: hypothetical protein D6722_09930, partial [Bacteroidetes bacterium]
EKPSLAGQVRLFLTPYAGKGSSQKQTLFFERYFVGDEDTILICVYQINSPQPPGKGPIPRR